ncbi:DNA glycosylase [Oscillibacter sp.]|uniref:DNA-3-methyladenine glycosylase family protein n=1 Tax=Oscillibacter sp. TaxID=1945593 RepID=UPI0028B0D232|nr:DNA glycosylase [Oscillibacter sp.]
MIVALKEEFDIGKIADSGQCFRLKRLEEGRFRAVAGNRWIELQEQPDAWALDCSKEEFDGFWRGYFDLDTDYAAFRAAVPEKDAYLTAATAFGSGIRILRQDPWEMLVTFIISQRKNIPAIRACVETLCRRYGEVLGPEYGFPSAEALAAAGEEGLRACALGYRAGYILAAARLVEAGTLNLAALAELDDEALPETLMTVPGVGVKVASCVALFGYHRIAAFPRDVWINRVVREHYRGRFPLYRYKGFAGVMQQYLFYYARCGEPCPAI